MIDKIEMQQMLVEEYSEIRNELAGTAFKKFMEHYALVFIFINFLAWF